MGTIIAFAIFALNIYSLVLIIRALMTWFPNLDYSNPLVRLMYDLTEPVLAPIRRAIPPTSGIDWSTTIAIVGIYVIQMLLRAF